MYNKRLSIEQHRIRIDYWKRKYYKRQNKPIQETEEIDNYNYEPSPDYFRFYVLECNYRETNRRIETNELPINLLLLIGGRWIETGKQATKLPNGAVVKDSNLRWVIFRNGRFSRYWFRF
jgi:hypothetical protein